MSLQEAIKIYGEKQIKKAIENGISIENLTPVNGAEA